MRRTALLDAMASALAVAFLIVATRHIDVPRDQRSLDALGYVLLVVAGGTLAVARRRAWVAVGAATVVLTIYIVRDYAGGPIFVSGGSAGCFLRCKRVWRACRSRYSGASVTRYEG